MRKHLYISTSLAPTWPTKKVADMELDIVADMEVDKVATIEVDMVADININIDIDINITMEIQFGARVGHGGWLIGPKFFGLED